MFLYRLIICSRPPNRGVFPPEESILCQLRVNISMLLQVRAVLENASDVLDSFSGPESRPSRLMETVRIRVL